MKRTLTALALIPVVAWVVLWADPWIFLAVLGTVACLCYREYNDIAAGYGYGAPGVVGYGAGLLLLVWWEVPWAVLAGITVVALVMVMRDADLSSALPRAALLVTGILYIFGCWKFARPLHELNPHWLMYGLMLNWVGDTGAYFIGRPFGKHKLAPRVSPQKSWEGSLASVVASVLVGTFYLQRFIPEVQLWQGVSLTAAANIAGQLGDLAESAMKRGAHVKDSGALLPGHGGFLDRVDSTLFALPLIYAFLKLYGFLKL
jgi:phosphatidate cytidylyltransferase